ncbi:tetratricopeptide repeat protein [Brevifollis gellanilyticus]|nr:tetratricopeptide repeat protein [Brevifollis gellanilyticus]
MKHHLLLAGVWVGVMAQAQDYQGASTVLQKLAAKAETKPVEIKKADPVEELRLKIKAMQKESADLSPDEAAKRWISLLDAYQTIPNDLLYSSRNYQDRLTFATLITALPPAPAWDALAAQLFAHKSDKPLNDAGLRLLAAVLTGDAAARQKAVDAMSASVAAMNNLEAYERENYERMINNVSVMLERLTGSDADQVSAYEKILAKVEKDPMKHFQSEGTSIEVPDLVRFADEARATALLERTLKLDWESISVKGKATQALAAKLALKNVSELQKPLWSLIHSLEDLPLYEALAKKFPDSQGYERQAAIEWYLIALVADGRTNDAVKIVEEETKRNGGEKIDLHLASLDELGRQGLGTQVHAFLKQVLSKDPTLPFWKSFIELSARANTSKEALELLRATMAKPGLPGKARAETQSHYYEALLAADERDEGIKTLRELVKAGPRSGISDGSAAAEEVKRRWQQVGMNVSEEMLKKLAQQSGGRQDGGESDHVNLAAKLAELGRLLEKPELVEEGITAALATLEKMPADNALGSMVVNEVVGLLLKQGRGVKAEEIMTSQLERMVTPDPSPERRGRVQDTASALSMLALVYHEAGRHADVMALFEKSPDWNAPDLTALETSVAESTPLVLMAARALKETGRGAEALPIIRRAAQDYPSKDAVYALLLELEKGDALLALLDQLAARDRFEERPLIWKSRALLDAGKVDEAEKAIRAAIAIDPSDGEQGKGDRMRAYAILAEVLEKKGDQDTAKIMRGAVSAIRKSETADDWWNAGLLSEAVTRYEASLLDFADAYCIQSRLALRYSELGQFEKAEKHYLRAFELMPDSFGRVESHCFGCEGAFSGKRAQNVADRVFTSLASQPGAKAQVHYLLGYLREAQGRDAEAADAYRQAVKIDPDYLNAWKNLANLASTTQMSSQESEHAILEIFRLDPASKHSGAGFDNTRNLRALWAALLTAEKNLPPMETGPLLALEASKAAIERKKTDGTWNAWNYQTFFARRYEVREHIARHPALNSLTNLLETLNRR